MNNWNQIPAFAWNTFSIGIAIMFTGVAFSTSRSQDVHLEAANVKLKATKSLNEARENTKRVEELLEQLQEREQAYNELKEQFDNLKLKSRQVRLLEPQIEKIDSLDTTELENLEVELQEKRKRLSEEIENLTSE